MEKENTSAVRKDPDDIEQRRPKPFRYVTDEDQITFERVPDDYIPCSIMSDDRTATTDMLAKTFETTLGIGDMKTVEQVLKRHERQRSKMNR